MGNPGLPGRNMEAVPDTDNKKNEVIMHKKCDKKLEMNMRIILILVITVVRNTMCMYVYIYIYIP